MTEILFALLAAGGAVVALPLLALALVTILEHDRPGDCVGDPAEWRALLPR